jgi:hypothetical protein
MRRAEEMGRGVSVSAGIDFFALFLAKLPYGMMFSDRIQDRLS